MVKSLILSLGFAALASAAVVQERAACNADYCLRALRITQTPTHISRAMADCSSYLAYTYTPTDTVTITGSTATISTATATVIQTVTVGQPRVDAKLLKDRDDGLQKRGTIPTYASWCSGEARYTSACSCIGVTAYTVTAPSPSTTITVTSSVPFVSTSVTVSTLAGVRLARPTPVFEPLLRADDQYRAITLPFAVQLAGGNSQTLIVDTNGFISFTGPVGEAFSNLPLPVSQSVTPYSRIPQIAICALWDDLVMDAGNPNVGVYYEVTGSSGSYMVQFEYIIRNLGTSFVSHFIISYKQNTPNVVTVEYIAAYADEATIGFQGLTISNQPIFAQYSYNQGGFTVPKTLRFDTVALTITEV